MFAQASIWNYMPEWWWLSLDALLYLAGAACLAGFLYLIYLDLGSALRREERARCFLQLLEIGLRQGRSFEQTITSLSASRDQTLGVYFHLLAAYIEQGHRLCDALTKVPYFLPSQVNAMLRVGEAIGDIRKVLPAAGQSLRGGRSDTQSGQNTLVAVLFLAPAGAAVIGCVYIWIFPRFKEIALDMLGYVPPFTQQALNISLWLAAASAIAWVGLYIAGALHAGGPRLISWIESGLAPLSHQAAFRLPWRRKRMQRDFTAMLALLLDAEVPEAKAVQLAAQSTGNRVFTALAERVVTDLGQGRDLPEALHWLDDAGEFRWRLRNAAGANVGFVQALAGWQEALDASADQQQQTVSQFVTTGFVFLNGAMVALMAFGMFQVLVSIIQEQVLW